jgi:hypothetical protein
MRRFDKNESVRKANLLAEQRYLKSKGLISEGWEEDSVETDNAKSASVDVNRRATEELKSHPFQIINQREKRKKEVRQLIKFELGARQAVQSDDEGHYEGAKPVTAEFGDGYYKRQGMLSLKQIVPGRVDVSGDLLEGGDKIDENGFKTIVGVMKGLIDASDYNDEEKQSSLQSLVKYLQRFK